ncbi:MAG TPA: hypothetical protein ENK66_01515, partial [Arcobacter sp.]|nr:hypothetical protein [Arcobacter sp.]
MIKIINYISILVVLTFFIGCAGTKSNIPVPQYSINQNDKLGFIIKSNDFMAHTHVANFSGFDKKYPKIVTKDIVKDMLNKQIKAQLVDLSNENFQNVQNLVIPKNEKWSVTSQKLYDKYLALGLKAILIIEEKPVFVSIPATHFDVPSTG